MPAAMWEKTSCSRLVRACRSWAARWLLGGSGCWVAANWWTRGHLSPDHTFAAAYARWHRPRSRHRRLRAIIRAVSGGRNDQAVWARERAAKLSDAAPAVEGKGDARAGAPGEPGAGSVWRVAGMPWLLGSAALWFSGFALLLPVAPLWVIHGGSDDLGAGLVTGVMMACTVLAQLSMRRVLPGLGWRWTLVLGSGLLGLPALGHLATDQLWAVTALAALRGFGFGIVTVCGATAVAALVGPGRRGRAIGALGLASAVPQFVLVPVAPWLAGRAGFGFGFVFVLAVLPALAIPLAWPIARAVGDSDRAPADGSGRGTPAAL